MAKQLSFLIIAIALSCCSKDEAGVNKSSDNAAQSEDKPKRKKRVKRDLGEGSMMLGETEWQASSARAKLRKGALKISMSRMDGSVSDTMVRHSLEFHIKDFDGPGEYTIPAHGTTPSLYIVMGVKIPKDDADDADKEAEKAAMEALTKSKTVMLHGAKVSVTSVTDTEIVGTFEHPGAKVPMTQGKFRATIRAKK